MSLKWNRKICIEYITQLKSPLEDFKTSLNADNSLLSKVRQRLGGQISTRR